MASRAAVVAVLGLALLSCGAEDTIVGSGGERIPSVAGQYAGIATIRSPDGAARSCSASVAVSQSQESVTLDRISTDDACFSRVLDVGTTTIDSAGQLTPVAGAYGEMHPGAGGSGAWFCNNQFLATGSFARRELQMTIAVSAAKSSPGGLACGSGEDGSGYEVAFKLTRG